MFQGYRSFEYTMLELRQLCGSHMMASLCRKYSVNDVTHPAKDKLVPLLLQHKQDDLFPAGRFVSLWHPYKVMAENLKYIAKNTAVRVTYEQGTESKCQAVSILATSKCGRGVCFEVELYRRGNDNMYAIQHILKALQHFQTMDYKGDIILALFGHKNDARAVDELAKTLKFRPGSQAANTGYLIGTAPICTSDKSNL